MENKEIDDLDRAMPVFLHLPTFCVLSLAASRPLRCDGKAQDPHFGQSCRFSQSLRGSPTCQSLLYWSKDLLCVCVGGWTGKLEGALSTLFARVSTS